MSHDLTYCVVSRLTEQKGMDLLAQTIDALVDSGARLAVLGSGDAKMEASFNAAAKRHPGRVGAVIGYDEPCPTCCRRAPTRSSSPRASSPAA